MRCWSCMPHCDQSRIELFPPSLDLETLYLLTYPETTLACTCIALHLGSSAWPLDATTCPGLAVLSRDGAVWRISVCLQPRLPGFPDIFPPARVTCLDFMTPLEAYDSDSFSLTLDLPFQFRPSPVHMPVVSWPGPHPQSPRCPTDSA
jgi:hypothetical protein